MTAAPQPRFASVDALRGITVAAMLLVNNPGDWSHIYAPFRHAEWHGCTPTDLIFPMFLFIVGVSITLALPAGGVAAEERGGVARAMLARAGRIVLLGLALHLLGWGLSWIGGEGGWFRPWGVLQRIGICYAAAGLLALFASGRVQWAVAGLLLAVYGLVLAWGGGEPWTNPASRLDTLLFGPLLYQFDPATGLGHDPEGLLSTLPAIATTLIGVRAGVWLKAGQVRPLLALGLGLAVAGLLLGWVQPMNKNLWTPAYALFTGGVSVLALLAAHRLIDTMGWPAVGRDFGRNAIVAYAGSSAMVSVLIATRIWGGTYHYGFAWMGPYVGAATTSLLFALCFVGLWAVIVHIMGRKGWRIRI